MYQCKSCVNNMCHISDIKIPGIFIQKVRYLVSGRIAREKLILF